jgi:hypothetical protein
LLASSPPALSSTKSVEERGSSKRLQSTIPLSSTKSVEERGVLSGFNLRSPSPPLLFMEERAGERR